MYQLLYVAHLCSRLPIMVLRTFAVRTLPTRPPPSRADLRGARGAGSAALAEPCGASGDCGGWDSFKGAQVPFGLICLKLTGVASWEYVCIHIYK